MSGIGSVEGYNLFQYCMNNPVMMIDSSRCWPSWQKVLAVVAIVTVVVAVVVVTGGTGLVGAMALGALEGAAIGAVAGAIVGGISGYIETGTVEGAVEGAVDGMVDGISGAVVGAATGGLGYVAEGAADETDAGADIFYQVTSEQKANEIMESGELIGKEFKEVYAWTVQPTLKQAELSGARSLETAIKFQVNPNTFMVDNTVDKSLQMIARVSQGQVQLVLII